MNRMGGMGNLFGEQRSGAYTIPDRRERANTVLQMNAGRRFGNAHPRSFYGMGFYGQHDVLTPFSGGLESARRTEASFQMRPVPVTINPIRAMLGPGIGPGRVGTPFGAPVARVETPAGMQQIVRLPHGGFAPVQRFTPAQQHTSGMIAAQMMGRRVSYAQPMMGQPTRQPQANNVLAAIFAQNRMGPQVQIMQPLRGPQQNNVLASVLGSLKANNQNKEYNAIRMNVLLGKVQNAQRGEGVREALGMLTRLRAARPVRVIGNNEQVGNVINRQNALRMMYSIRTPFMPRSSGVVRKKSVMHSGNPLLVFANRR